MIKQFKDKFTILPFHSQPFMDNMDMELNILKYIKIQNTFDFFSTGDGTLSFHHHLV